jgi:hypothetical protein
MQQYEVIPKLDIMGATTDFFREQRVYHLFSFRNSNE